MPLMMAPPVGLVYSLAGLGAGARLTGLSSRITIAFSVIPIPTPAKLATRSLSEEQFAATVRK